MAKFNGFLPGQAHKWLCGAWGQQTLQSCDNSRGSGSSCSTCSLAAKGQLQPHLRVWGHRGSAGVSRGSGGVSLGGNNREKKNQIQNTGIGRWKVTHYPSLLPGLLNTPHPHGVGGRKSCLARGQLESPPNHPQVLHGQLEASGEQGRGVKDYAKGQASETAGSSSAHLYHRH